MRFESGQFELTSAPQEVSDFIGTPSNLIEILPQDRIENWKAEGETCSFKIKGLADIHLQLSRSSAEEVVYASASDKPFSFELIVMLPTTNNGCTVQAAFDADVNSFMGMMLKQPLTNFLNSLGERLKEKYS